MLITTSSEFSDKKIKKQIKLVSTTICYGIGFITLMAKMICDVFGLRCKMYEKKVDKAKVEAINLLVEKAKANNANGIINLSIQIDKTTVEIYGLCVEVE